MEHLKNKDFWEKEEVIDVQNQETPITTDFELSLYNKSLSLLKENRIKIENIKVFGCGTGRELLEIHNIFQPKYIMATDISSNMIDGCKVNIKKWKIDDVIDTQVVAAEKFITEKKFQLVTIMNSMLTYVSKKNDRDKIFEISNNILKDKGVLIGVVHNQKGTLKKTIYFMLRNFFKIFLKDNPGNRKSGYKGYKVEAYYYTKKGLKKDLKKANFKSISIMSLDEYYASMNKQYNRKKGYNNLLFIASK